MLSNSDRSPIPLAVGSGRHKFNVRNVEFHMTDCSLMGDPAMIISLMVMVTTGWVTALG